MDFFDAHFHLVPESLCLLGKNPDDFAFAEKEENFSPLLAAIKKELSTFVKENDTYEGITCAHSIAEYEIQKRLVLALNSEKNINIKTSFGLHPQNPALENAGFLKNLLEKNEIDAIGEAGFDLFTEHFKSNLENQKKAFEMQLNLAAQFQKPLVIHIRKGIDLIFEKETIKKLKKVPKVIFHSFPSPAPLALSILEKNKNTFFSFGKPLLNGKKHALECVKKLPKESILFETDAPFQILKNEIFTPLSDIKKLFEIV